MERGGCCRSDARREGAGLTRGCGGCGCCCCCREEEGGALGRGRPVALTAGSRWRCDGSSAVVGDVSGVAFALALDDVDEEDSGDGDNDSPSESLLYE